jgi:nicotinate-nucleotide adenylyltransferase
MNLNGKTKRRIGIFGGTFDPPHIGHFILTAEAMDQLRLERLLWVLTPEPPHKEIRSISPLDGREELLRAALSRDPSFEFSSVDLDRPGPHFALDTVRIIRDMHPGDEIFYLIGGDSLTDLPGWHKPMELISSIDGLGVMRRPKDEVDIASLEANISGISQKLTFIQSPLMEISSSEIRWRIKNGKPYRYYLPREVYEIIVKGSWYQQAP